MNACNDIEHINVCLDMGGQVSLFNVLFHCNHIVVVLVGVTTG